MDATPVRHLGRVISATVAGFLWAGGNIDGTNDITKNFLNSTLEGVNHYEPFIMGNKVVEPREAGHQTVGEDTNWASETVAEPPVDDQDEEHDEEPEEQEQVQEDWNWYGEKPTDPMAISSWLTEGIMWWRPSTTATTTVDMEWNMKLCSHK